MPTRGINVAMDTGTRAFDCSFGNLMVGHTDDNFDHSLRTLAFYALPMLLAKRPRCHFALLAPYALTAHRVGRLT